MKRILLWLGVASFAQSTAWGQASSNSSTNMLNPKSGSFVQVPGKEKGKATRPAIFFDPVVVTTIAGTGEAGFADGAGATAKFNAPVDVARDAEGNTFVADAYNNRIRKISPAGVVSTFAGTGVAGNTNGNALSASFNNPSGVAVDKSGNVYVADEGNNVIRKITRKGVVSTFAGSGFEGFADGDAATAQFSYVLDVIVDPSGNLYVVDCGNHSIRKITPDGYVVTFAGDGTAGTEDGPALSARFYGPRSVALDPFGNFWVTDVYGPLRKISADGMVSSVFTENFIYGFRFGVASDDASNIYLVDILGGNENYIYKITPGGTGALVAGSVNGFADGTGAQAMFNFPEGLTTDASGDVYVADVANNRIRKISVPAMEFSADAGNASIEQMFPVSAVNLRSDLRISVPSAYEISSTPGSGFQQQLLLPPASGELVSVPVYIRLKAGLSAGTYNGGITLHASGASTQTLHVSGTVVDVYASQKKLKAFPNPNNGSFTLHLADVSVNEITVFDPNGNMILRKAVNTAKTPGRIDMDLGRVASGVYLVQATGRHGTYATRIVVK